MPILVKPTGCWRPLMEGSLNTQLSFQLLLRAICMPLCPHSVSWEVLGYTAWEANRTALIYAAKEKAPLMLGEDCAVGVPCLHPTLP